MLLENLRAGVVTLDKVLTESTRQNDKEHEELFERVWFLEDESHNSLATLVAKGGARVKRRVIKPWKTSNVGWTGPLIALTKRLLPMRKKFPKKSMMQYKPNYQFFLAGAQQKFMENPNALLSGAFMKIVSSRVEEEHSLFVRDIGANVEEFKIEMHSEMEELKKKWRGGS